MIHINLGCGLNYFESDNYTKWINIDKSKMFKADEYLDFDNENLKLPYEDETIDFIEASHILEHIKNIIPLMNECYRILKKGGVMSVKVPQGIGIWADPTHVRGFSVISFRYYCNYPLSEGYGITAKFREKHKAIIPNEDGGELNVVLEK